MSFGERNILNIEPNHDLSIDSLPLLIQSQELCGLEGRYVELKVGF